MPRHTTLCALALFLLLASAPRAHAADVCAPPRYNLAPSYSTAVASATSVVAADFNADGRTDIAAAGSQLVVLTNEVSGSFSAPLLIPVPLGAQAVATADFNGDNKPDLVTAHSGGVSVLLNAGGFFAEPADFSAPGQVLGPHNIAVGDLNGDGRADAVLTNANSTNVTVFLGDGAGSFPTRTNFNTVAVPQAAAVADLNGDGKRDLAVATQAGLTVLLGDGAGGFAVPASFTVGGSPLSVAVADFNGDGRPDVATGNFNTDRISVLIGNGAGSFSAPSRFFAGHDARFVTIADLNADGRTDLVATNRDADTVSVLLGDGAGSFAPSLDFATGPGPVAAAVADFNNDGRADVATANAFSRPSFPANVTVMLGAGTGRLFAPPSINFTDRSGVGDPRAGITAVLRRDFNGDGRADLATSNFFTGQVSLLVGNGAGSFTRTDFNAGSRLGEMASADFNGDGRPDLAVLTDDPDGVAVLINGGGSFAAPTLFPAGFNPRALAVADFNADGRADLAVTNPDAPGLSVLLGNGAGGFSAPNTFAAGHSPGDVVAADFNGDGRADLAVSSVFAGSGAVLLGDGAGSFAVPRVFAAGEMPVGIGSADFNADGRPDLVVSNSFSGDAWVLAGDGAGGFNVSVKIPLGFQPGYVEAGDFNADGAADVAVAMPRENRVTMLLGDGTGVFAGQHSFLAGANPSGFAAGDFNGDGRADLAVGNFTSDTLTVLLGVQTATFGVPPPRLCAATFYANEGARAVRVPVSRGTTLGSASIGYRSADLPTSNPTASARSDYTPVAGTLRFAPGEAVKGVDLLLTDDRIAEAPFPEVFAFLLEGPLGSYGEPSFARVYLTDNDQTTGPSPVSNAAFDARFFVRQHYLDFLNREPDQAGLDFWAGQITECEARPEPERPGCREERRVNVSAAFFLSIEFQQTGYLAYRTHAAAFGPQRVDGPVPINFADFLPDMRRIAEGVVVGRPGWEQVIEANKVAYFDEFVARSQFTLRYPATMSAAAFVDALNANTSGSLSQAERDGLVNSLSAGTLTRAQVLRAAAEDTDFAAREKNRAFVLMQYFGYLRRYPSEQPEATLDFQGYNFWLGKLEEHHGDYVAAEMVKSFIVSEEYKRRFGN